jgi:hypothetical protein
MWRQSQRSSLNFVNAREIEAQMRSSAAFLQSSLRPAARAVRRYGHTLGFGRPLAPLLARRATVPTSS